MVSRYFVYKQALLDEAERLVQAHVPACEEDTRDEELPALGQWTVRAVSTQPASSALPSRPTGSRTGSCDRSRSSGRSEFLQTLADTRDSCVFSKDALEILAGLRLLALARIRLGRMAQRQVSDLVRAFLQLDCLAEATTSSSSGGPPGSPTSTGQARCITAVPERSVD